MSALERWGELLRGWGIPEEIVEKAPESPWGFPVELFRRRAERAAAGESSPSARRAMQALPKGGWVLDIGVGAGAASLPLASRASMIVGIDQSHEMLEEFRRAANALHVPSQALPGTWPEVAHLTATVDVVVCHHVLYNVQDLSPFVREMTAHAKRRVVVEITDRHPLAWMSDLWERFHGLKRPDGPTADDAHAALRELGYLVRREDFERGPGGGSFDRREDALALVRRRLCLPADRDGELAEALGERLAEHDGLWSAGPPVQPLATLWWDTTS